MEAVQCLCICFIRTIIITEPDFAMRLFYEGISISNMHKHLIWKPYNVCAFVSFNGHSRLIKTRSKFFLTRIVRSDAYLLFTFFSRKCMHNWLSIRHILFKPLSACQYISQQSLSCAANHLNSDYRNRFVNEQNGHKNWSTLMWFLYLYVTSLVFATLYQNNFVTSYVIILATLNSQQT